MAKRLIRFTWDSDGFARTRKFIRHVYPNPQRINSILHEYGKRGVEILKEVTPVRTGLTARSWYYEIERDTDAVSLLFKNSNMLQQTAIVKLLVYGHIMPNGTWYSGYDFVSPVVKPLFEDLAKELWREVKT